MVGFDRKDGRSGRKVSLASRRGAEKAGGTVIGGYANILKHESAHQKRLVVGKRIKGRANTGG